MAYEQNLKIFFVHSRTLAKLKKKLQAFIRRLCTKALCRQLVFRVLMFSGFSIEFGAYIMTSFQMALSPTSIPVAVPVGRQNDNLEAAVAQEISAQKDTPIPFAIAVIFLPRPVGNFLENRADSLPSLAQGRAASNRDQNEVTCLERSVYGVATGILISGLIGSVLAGTAACYYHAETFEEVGKNIYIAGGVAGGVTALGGGIYGCASGEIAGGIGGGVLAGGIISAAISCVGACYEHADNFEDLGTNFLIFGGVASGLTLLSSICDKDNGCLEGLGKGVLNVADDYAGVLGGAACYYASQDFHEVGENSFKYLVAPLGALKVLTSACLSEDDSCTVTLVKSVAKGVFIAALTAASAACFYEAEDFEELGVNYFYYTAAAAGVAFLGGSILGSLIPGVKRREG